MTNGDAPFELQSSAVGDALVIAVSGEIDMTCAPELGKAIDIVSDHARRVVVDLTAVTFLDSSGLNALVRSRRALDERQIALCVVAPAGTVVRRVFEITRLTDALAVVDSLDEALAPD